MKQFKEPSWTESETSLCELWKNPLIDPTERLLIADGAIAFRDAVIKNLRKQSSRSKFKSCRKRSKRHRTKSKGSKTVLTTFSHSGIVFEI